MILLMSVLEDCQGTIYIYIYKDSKKNIKKIMNNIILYISIFFLINILKTNK